jgi:ketosteroid isomerase-like protein
MRYFKINIIALTAVLIYSCNPKENQTSQSAFNADKEKKEINMMLGSFNKAAADANFDQYFSFYTDDAIFTGTDATERWEKEEFMVWAKPIFARGRAWSFTALERHIYFDSNGDLAWFDELLNTQMKICRGSGVLIKQGNQWKVKQYILSATIPNPIMDNVVKMKATAEDSLINKMVKTK